MADSDELTTTDVAPGRAAVEIEGEAAEDNPTGVLEIESLGSPATLCRALARIDPTSNFEKFAL